MVHLSGKFSFIVHRDSLLVGRLIIIFIFLEAQEKLKKYREDNERKSKEVLELWDSSVKHKIKQLGNDRKCFNEKTKTWKYLGHLFTFIFMKFKFYKFLFNAKHKTTR